MADKNFKGYVITILLAGLFIICIYKFALGTGESYDRDMTVDDNLLDLTSLEQNLNDTSVRAQNWENTMQSDNPFVATGALILQGLWSIMTSMWSSIGIIFNIFLGGMSNILGLPPIVSGVILAIFILGLIFAGWKAIKAGD